AALCGLLLACTQLCCHAQATTGTTKPETEADWTGPINLLDQAQLPMDSTTSTLDQHTPTSPWPSVGSSDPQSTTQTASGQASGVNSNYVLKGNFFQRLMQFYHQDWAGTNPSTPAPAKRGLPAPLDSPPFPSSDWIYGGAPNIGGPDTNTYPLMAALNLENSRTKVYGWVATSFDFSTSGRNNFPVSYAIFPFKNKRNKPGFYTKR